MKIAVLADVHSNYIALSTCLDEAKKKGAEEFIFLGDYLGDLAYPRKTLDILYELRKQYPCTFIRGNKENYWINHRKNTEEVWEYGKTTQGMLKYNYDQLTDSDIDFFEEMPIVKEMKYAGMPEFTVCHGSPFKVNQSMRKDYDYIDDLVKELPNELTICAHFHIQSIYVRFGKTVINPGAIGVPLHSGGKAQFMMLESGEIDWKYEFVTLAYDVPKTLEGMDKEELFAKAPGWYKITKHLLTTGEVSHVAALSHVADSYCASHGECTWDDIPEDYWSKQLEVLLGENATC